MEVIKLGLTPYQEALTKQLSLLEEVIKDSSKEYLILCSHPPIVTLGRATKPAIDLQGWTGESLSVSRGGKATYHGPNQIIAYPILDLNRRGRDLHLHLRNLEQSLISTLDDYGVKSEGNRPEATGVWIQNKKIASIGIAVKKWVSYHGIAMNFTYDPQAFQGISPCGFNTETMTSLEQQLSSLPAKAEFQKNWEEKLLKQLSPS